MRPRGRLVRPQNPERSSHVPFAPSLFFLKHSDPQARQAATATRLGGSGMSPSCGPGPRLGGARARGAALRLPACDEVRAS